MTVSSPQPQSARRTTPPVRLVVVGDVLLDRDLDGSAERLAPDVPVPVVADPHDTARPGGAGLAAALSAVPAQGVTVTLVTAVADDAAGRRTRRLLEAVGVDVRALPADGATGEKIRVAGRGLPLVRVDRGGDATPPRPGGDVGTALAALREADAVLVADYGRGVAADERVRAAVSDAAAAGVPVVWDPHPRGAPPVAGVRLATPNRAEAARFTAAAPTAGGAVGWACGAADDLRLRWSAANVCVTLGASGVVLVGGDGTPLHVPAATVEHVADPCGAGDRFASAAAIALGRGALPSEAVSTAVQAATRFVAAGGAAAWTRRRPADAAAADQRETPVTTAVAGPVDPAPWPRQRDAGGPAPHVAMEADGPDEPLDREAAGALVRRVRDAGGTVVATGGCFDLLHAGHVRLLAEARRLGDLLVVCLNSDASVRRLKGPGRPLNGAADRAAVLQGLSSVDAVVVFDESTPEALLDHLRPDLWVKGADYAVTDLPEAPLLATWGGHAMVLPYLAGRSTTTLLEEARRAH